MNPLDPPAPDPWVEDDADSLVTRDPVDQETSIHAQRTWWDEEAGSYYAEHGAFLGDASFVWGPEGWTEAELGLLDPWPGMPPGPVLEIGAGGAQCSRWLAGSGRQVVASDLSGGMLATAARLNHEHPPAVPLVQCDGARLPFGDGSFSAVFTAYGVIPFVADPLAVMREAARVLAPGGRFVFSTTHPIRWAFPDLPGPEGLSVHGSYFDTRPYVETSPDGRVTYVEHHRTLGERVRDVVAAGLQVVDLIEPMWPERNTSTWGGWSPLRGQVLPGTLILVAERLARPSCPN